MAQTVWNTTQGRFFTLTDPNGTESISRLAFHADFLLVLLAPFYAIWPNPKILLLIQTLVLGAGCFFIYFIAIRIIRNKTIALTLGLCYLVNPSIQRTNLYDFHAVVLASTFLLACWYFILRKNYKLFLLFAILAGITKEQVWITIGLFGLFISIKEFMVKRRYLGRHVLFGLLVFLGASLFFYYFIWIAIPQAYGSKHFALKYFTDFGDSPGSIVSQIFFSPEKAFSLLFLPELVIYYKQLFAPLGYTSLLGLPLLGFVFHDFLINTLSNNKNFHQIYYQYTATLTPFLFLASIYGIAWLKKYTKSSSFSTVVIIVFLLVSSLYTSLLYSPMPWSKEPNIAMFTKPLANKTYIEKALQDVPDNATIATSNALGSHLSNREHIFTVPNGTFEADYIALLLSDTSAQPSMRDHRDLANRLRNNPNYILLAADGDFLLFRKRRITVLYY
jgi:uncharacterized membrane protein